MDSEMDSILQSIKKLIGTGDNYDYFDADLIIHINAAFSRLCQLGVGPSRPFRITGADERWCEFLHCGRMEDVKQYIALSVRKVFDPPANSFLMSALDSQIDKLEWLLNSVAEVGY